VGADQHIPDDDDRADLCVVAYELYSQYGSLRKVREHLAVHETTRRVCGGTRHFSISTIRDWIDEGRRAEQYIELLNIARERVDSNTRLSLLGAMAWDMLRPGGACETASERLQALDLMRKLERDRMDLLGLKAPVKVQNVNGDDERIPPEMISTIDALARRNAEHQRALVDDAYPGATVVPAHQRPTRRRPPGSDRRTS
jgi:hypothetical protein